jgi:antirestriction protein ArdC
MTTANVYQEITDSIISELEKGALPWVKPWKADNTADKNIVSQKPYQGINRLILGMQSMIRGYDVPVWGTFKHWQSLGASVRKGEKGTKIVFFSPVTKESQADNGETEISKYAVLKAYWVFNASQVDGVTITKPVVSDTSFNPIAAAEDRIIKTGAMISHGGDAAFYAPSQDRIQMPNKGTFDNESSYYATVFHELTHWTSDKTRCDRDLSKGRFGNPEYAFEELVAELGAAFLCNDHNIQGELRHAGYIQSWLKALKNDNKAIFKAAALAQKAADYINQCDATVGEIAA